MYYPFLIHHSGQSKGKFKGKAQIREKDKVIIFPSGAKVEFAYLENEAETKKNFQGAQLTAAYFEEFGNHSEYNFNYIRTRMRSKSKYKSFIRCTLNPEPNHFCLKYLSRFIGDDGFAIEEYSGRIAYYIVDKGEVVTSWEEDLLRERYPSKSPRKYTFIPSKLSDNPKMLEGNSEYAEDLEANDPANAELLLLGNWKYKPAANGVWDRTTIQLTDKLPIGCKAVRAYDKASSKPAKEGGDSKQLDPDYTASVKFYKDRDGFVYVTGNYQTDSQGRQLARYREKPGPRDNLIEKQAFLDGDDCTIYLPKDPGQAGAVEFAESAKKLQALGFIVKEDPTPINKSKRIRFEPFAAACYAGNVFWLKDTFDMEVWDYIMLELENFDGMKNNGYKDDFVDAFATAYAACCKERIIQTPKIPTINAPTVRSQMMA